jgi:hypothetical protein
MVAELTNKRLRRDSFFSVDELIAAINEFLATWNENPKPFVWTATVDSIVAKLARCRQTLEQIQPGCTSPKRRKRPSSQFLDTTLEATPRLSNILGERADSLGIYGGGWHPLQCTGSSRSLHLTLLA